MASDQAAAFDKLGVRACCDSHKSCRHLLDLWVTRRIMRPNLIKHLAEPTTQNEQVQFAVFVEAVILLSNASLRANSTSFTAWISWQRCVSCIQCQIETTTSCDYKHNFKSLQITQPKIKSWHMSALTTCVCDKFSREPVYRVAAEVHSLTFCWHFSCMNKADLLRDGLQTSAVEVTEGEHVFRGLQVWTLSQTSIEINVLLLHLMRSDTLNKALDPISWNWHRMKIHFGNISFGCRWVECVHLKTPPVESFAPGPITGWCLLRVENP